MSYRSSSGSLGRACPAGWHSSFTERGSVGQSHCAQRFWFAACGYVGFRLGCGFHL